MNKHRFFLLFLWIAIATPGWAATRVWINASGGQWTNAANWSPAVAPVDGDIVFITNNGTYTVTLNNSRDLTGLTIGGTSGTQTLLVGGGTLSLTNAIVRANGELTVTNGGLTRHLVIGNGGVLNLGGTADKTFYQFTLINQGTVNWNGGRLLGGNTPTTVISNFGLWQINSDSQMAQGIGGPPQVFVNSGTLRKVGGAGTTTISTYQFINTGAVEVQNGILEFNNAAGSLLGGTWTTSAGGNVRFNGGTYTETGGSFGGAGTNRFANGTLTLQNNILAGLKLVGGDVQTSAAFQQAGAITNLTLDGSRLVGTNRVGNGILIVNNGGITDRLTVQVGGSLNFETSADKTLYQLTLINQGTVNWNAGRLLGGNTPTTTITNSGLWQINSDSQMAQGIGGPPQVFVNSGTLRKVGGTNTTTISTYQFINTGTVQVQAGMLEFNNAAGSLLGGTWTTSPGANVRFNGGTYTEAGGSFGGGGTNRFVNGTLTLANNILAGLKLVGGDLVIGPLFQQAGAITNLTLEGIRLTGTNRVGTGTLQVNSGGLTDWLTILPGGSLNFETNVDKTLYQLTLINQGTVNWNAGRLLGGNTPTTVISNFGLWQINSDNQMAQGIGGPPQVFVNAGTLRKVGGAGTTTISTYQFINIGAVEVQMGILEFNNAAGSLMGGTFTASSGASIRLNGGTYAEAGGTFGGAGTNRFVNGTLMLPNNILPGLLLVGGDVELGSSFQQGGAITNLTLDGSRLTGTNRVGSGTLRLNSGGLSSWLTVLAGGTLSFDTAADKTLYQLTLINQGTVNWNAGRLLGGNTPTTIITNSGLWQINSDNQMAHGIGGPPMVFMNSGTLRKIGGAGTTTISTYQFINTGAVEVQSGTLEFNNAAGSLMGGTFTASAGANIRLDGGTYMESGGIFGGAGTNRFLSGTLTLPNNILPGLKLVGGDVRVGAAFQQGGAITNLTLDGSRLTGTNRVGSGTLIVNDGGASGQLTIQAGGALNFETSADKTLYQLTLLNQGTVNWNGGRLLGGNTPTTLITNAGLWQINSDSQMAQGIGGPILVFVNSGTLRKVGGANTSSISTYQLNNSGLIEVLTGRLDLPTGAIQNGGTTRLAGGRLGIQSGSYQLQGGVFEGAGEFIGTLYNAALLRPNYPGVLRITGTYTQDVSGAVHFKLGGTTAGTNHSQVQITGAFQLATGAPTNSALSFELAPGYQPAVGNMFTVLTYASRNNYTTNLHNETIAGSGATLRMDVAATNLKLTTLSASGLPFLTIQRNGNFAVVSWPAAVTGFFLQSTPTLNPISWTNVPGVVNNTHQFTPTSQAHFRLIRP
jgi:hypothetical protein